MTIKNTQSTYVTEVKNELIKNGSTIVFTKDNVIVASEVSESQYLELLKNSNVEKMDVLSLKRYDTK